MNVAAVMACEDDLAAADTGFWPDDNTTIGGAADPTASIPWTPQAAAPALAWADDDGSDEPIRYSWVATVNYAVFLIVCGIIAAAATAVFAWWGTSRP